MEEVEFSSLVGQKLIEIKGLEKGSQEIVFITDSGYFEMYHSQDCCEYVTVEDIHGDPENAIGEVIEDASVVTSKDNPVDVVKEDQDSFTWTYYYVRTKSSSFTIRWYGESNGYYSEEVDFCKK